VATKSIVCASKPLRFGRDGVYGVIDSAKNKRLSWGLAYSETFLAVSILGIPSSEVRAMSCLCSRLKAGLFHEITADEVRNVRKVNGCELTLSRVIFSSKLNRKLHIYLALRHLLDRVERGSATRRPVRPKNKRTYFKHLIRTQTFRSC